jgi:hypothetical protein
LSPPFRFSVPRQAVGIFRGVVSTRKKSVPGGSRALGQRRESIDRRSGILSWTHGFYAATKRKAQADSDGYEPTLAVATKNLGDRVEIRIRDNGTGIPPEAKEKIFNPFFTTKPAGEGTGLGLSISHDIIVKQHSGSIEVDTVPGEFTEIRVILLRAAVFP